MLLFVLEVAYITIHNVCIFLFFLWYVLQKKNILGDLVTKISFDLKLLYQGKRGYNQTYSVRDGANSCGQCIILNIYENRKSCHSEQHMETSVLTKACQEHTNRRQCQQQQEHSKQFPQNCHLLLIFLLNVFYLLLFSMFSLSRPITLLTPLIVLAFQQKDDKGRGSQIVEPDPKYGKAPLGLYILNSLYYYTR